MKPSLATRTPRWVLPLVTTVACVGLAEAATRADNALLPARYVPPPSQIVAALYDDVQTHIFWTSVSQTMTVWAGGLAVAAVVAVPLGLLIGSSVWTFRGTRAVIELLRPVPGVALLPVLVLLVGLGFKLILYLVIIGSIWPLLMQALYGVQDIDAVARDMVAAYRIGPVRRFFRLVLPSTTPYVVTGLRISALLALNVAVGVELIVGSQGLGYQISVQELGNDIPSTYAYIATTGIIGVLINFAARRLERSVLSWHPSQREQVPQ